MADFNEFPHRLEFDRAEFIASQSQPAPLNNFQVSEKTAARLEETKEKIKELKEGTSTQELRADAIVQAHFEPGSREIEEPDHS